MSPRDSRQEPSARKKTKFTETGFNAILPESGDHDGWSDKEGTPEDSDEDDGFWYLTKMGEVSRRLGCDCLSRLLLGDDEPTTDDERFITDMRDRVMANVVL